MSHFYGTLQGTRGNATRCGDKKSGLQTVAASWAGAIRVYLYRKPGETFDRYTVRADPWYGVGDSALLAQGIVGKVPAPDYSTHESLRVLLSDGVALATDVVDLRSTGDLAGAVNKLEAWVSHVDTIYLGAGS